MKIGNLEVKNNIFLAPLAGVTDISYRGICKSMGASLVYTEMISAKALYYGSKKTQEMLSFSNEEKPVGVQLFGSEPKVMAEVCRTFNENNDICVIDINMGCPAPKIVKNGEGSALMKNVKLAGEIVQEMKKVCTKPVTVKFRKGFDEEHINAVEFAKAMESAGADAITVHGRTRAQMYEGKADWDIIRKVKEAVKVPVIGNGDVFFAKDALALIDYTRCDGVMVARGAMGNPWIFRQIKQYFNNEDVIYPTDEEKIDMCIKHLKLALHYHGEAKAVREMRKHISWYIKGIKNCTEIKNKINTEKCSENVIKILTEYKNALRA